MKKLDDAPDLASKWAWSREESEVVVVTDGGERVRLRSAPLTSVDQLGCSCLLAPKCLHVLAVARALPITDDAPAAEPGAAAPAEVARTLTTPAMREAAAQAFRAASVVIEAGANGAGALVQADLLAAVHACRATGLPRIAAAGLRVVHGVRALRSQVASASLPELSADLAELVAASVHVSRLESVSSTWVGTARRAYEEVGALRVLGLFSEAVVTKGGYAGVVTHVVDGAGRLSTVSDVVPGDASRAPAAYEAGIEVGDATLSHRELARAGLFLASATRSADGRLGAGKGVRAVRAGASTWDDPEIAPLFAAPIDDQRGRIHAALGVPLTERPGGWDLVFVTATVLGACEGSLALALSSEPRVLFASPPVAHASLRTRANLERLARAPGLAIRAIGRVVLDRPGAIELLAIGAPAGEAPPERALRLPAAWGGRACLCFDAIEGAMITGEDATAHVPPSRRDERVDPLAAIRRRVERAALGGRATLRVEEADALVRERALLQRRFLPGAAARLDELFAAATTASRDLRGARARVDPARFAEAWARAALHVEAAAADLALARW
ncbi:MAG: hypothetical protein U0353_35500 [Sandaracinus sp.]